MLGFQVEFLLKNFKWVTFAINKNRVREIDTSTASENYPIIEKAVTKILDYNPNIYIGGNYLDGKACSNDKIANLFSLIFVSLII